MRSDERRVPPGTDRDGFAMAMVLLLLFAIGMAGALGYEMVRTEAAMALTNQEGSQAYNAAEAGLERFMAEARDSVPSERTYAVLDASADVASREVMDGPYPNKRYLIRSVGSRVDPRFSGDASQRTLYQMADFKRSPVALFAALMSPSDTITLNNVDDIDGNDEATSADCPEGGVADLRGVLGGGVIRISGGGVSGVGGDSLRFVDPNAVLDSLGVDWNLLTDASFPVDNDDTWPDFLSMPSDSFPVIRWNADLTASASQSGRGLLIVDGQLSFQDSPSSHFVWEGLILSRSITSDTDRNFEIHGALVVGLDGSGAPFRIRNKGTIRFNSCYVLDAGRELAHLAPLKGTWWEGL